MKHTMIFGHKNPDTDSVTSAVALSYLKNELNEPSKPYILGPMSKESKFVLDYFDVSKPDQLNDVKIQMKDLDYDETLPLTLKHSIFYSYNYMNEHKIRTLPVISEVGKLLGLITMKDIAMSLINKDSKNLKTTYSNLITDLDAKEIVKASSSINGVIKVIAFESRTVKEENILDNNSIIIVGDRLEILRHAIAKKVPLIVITGGRVIPEEYVKEAMACEVNIISTSYDTYETTRRINLTNFIGTILNKSQLISFKDDDYLDDCKEIIQTSKHSKFPVIDNKRYYKGIVSRRHIINPGKKDVILVDHNEYSQSATGIKEANILEVIDHHKIGDISTTIPISFRNLPYGSTNTIIYYMYLENKVEIPHNIAGLMLSGIISDTLLLKSPTTTINDKIAVEELSKSLDIPLDEYAMQMFVEGTSIKGKSVDDIFYTDYKEFMIEGSKVGISQVFTLDFSIIESDIENYISTINSVNKDKDNFVTVIVVTDIVKEGSYFIYSEKSGEVLKIAFNTEMHQGKYINNIVSRKKQIIPMLSDAISLVKR